MWKTGTSSGRRDAWAVGHNGRLAIGVWIGKFSGAGHPAFVGAEAAEPLLASVFASESVRNNDLPPAPAALLVTRPLELFPLSDNGPKIVAPSDRVTLVCLTGEVTPVPVSAMYAEEAVWFLNRRPVASDSLVSLTLSRGAYELRCVDRSGRSDAVRFTVE